MDTGAGLERVAALPQGVHCVYETDAFADIIREIEGWTGTSYDAGGRADGSLRVLADHGRSMTLLASDGIEPSNEGRGYVLRRVIRRAVLHGRRLGLEGDITTRLHERVVSLLADSYPELSRHSAHVARVLAGEEERFSRTLELGGRLLDEVLARSGNEGLGGGRLQAPRHLRLPVRAHGRDR